MKHCAWICLFAFTVAPPARGGTLVTRDGRTLNGDLAIADDQRITITDKSGAARTFALGEISQATFAQPAIPESAYGEPRGAPAEKGPRNVLVEYFADREFKQRKLARYESSINFSYDVKHPPDPLIPAKCAVRYTARLTAPAAQDYTFTAEGDGGLRLWVDDKLKIDKWGGRGHVKASAVATLNPAKPSVIRMEVLSGEHTYLARLQWAGRGLYSPSIPTGSYGLPVDAPAPPRVAFVSPADGAQLRDPEVVEFEVRAEGSAGATIAGVDLFYKDALIAALTAPPFRYTWRNPPVGQFMIQARTTDDRGISGYAEPIDVGIADTGENHSLPAPWGQQTLGKKEKRIPGSSSYDGGSFRITKAGGQVTEDDDSPQFVYQAIDGDFQIVAHLASLTPADNTVGPLAGIMVRESMTSLDRFVAVVVGPQATMLARRPDYWGRTMASDRSEAVAPWLKIVRMGHRQRAYTSPDGKTWSLLGGERIEFPERVFVGLCAMARSKETPAVATFDHVSITPGPPALAYTNPGILFRSGTFLAAEVLGIKDGTLAYNREGKRRYAPVNDVARLVYKPVPAELAEKAPGGQSGALLGSGDFVEGDVKEVSYRVTVSNLVLGPRTMGIKTNDVLAIYLKDAEDAKLTYMVTAMDGSVYQSKALKVNGGVVALEDPTVGRVELSLKQVARLAVN
ncbi:MAG TPA: PA14 domain-containing protein [Tepidisphaeraceae bacterium]